MEKTTWGDPILNVQVFAPQEYCSNCYDYIRNSPNWRNDYTYHYIDINKDGRYQRNERFNSSGVSASASAIQDQSNSNVNVYVRNFYFIVKLTENTTEPSVNTRYDNDGLNSPRNYDEIRIIDGIAYYKVQNAS